MPRSRRHPSNGPPAARSVARTDPNLEAIAWYCNNSGRATHPVGQKGPNSWMVYGVLGNADEWQHNHLTGNPPPPGPLHDPFGKISQRASKMRRGGSVVDWPSLLRAAAGLSFTWTLHIPAIGFRLVRSLPRADDGGVPGPRN